MTAGLCRYREIVLPAGDAPSLIGAADNTAEDRAGQDLNGNVARRRFTCDSDQLRGSRELRMAA
jgi:hypothetical protein